MASQEAVGGPPGKMLQTQETGPSSPFGRSGATVLQAHGVTTNNGHVVLAGGNVNIQQFYNLLPETRVDIASILRLVNNLRNIHLDVLSKATPGTGIWLLKTDKFSVWLDPNGDLKILWGTGIPGAGKSVMASIVIEELEARVEAGDSICVCYVYFRYTDIALTVRDILEIFVKQTVERHPECVPLAERVYARHLQEDTQPTETELLQLLRQFIKTKWATFYILDALDEALDRLQVDIVQKLSSLNARLFITSRPLKAVEARARDVYRFPIFAQDGDLDLHIAWEISRSRGLPDLLEKVGSSLRDEIVQVVKRKCGGMFLHASLQLDALCECVTVREVTETLEAFPSRIEDVYHQTWYRVTKQKPSYTLLAKTVLVWVLNASRSMTLEELERAVATSPETFKFTPDRLAPGTMLIGLCCGLVTLEEETRLVRLVHPTAKDILQGLLVDMFPHPQSHLATVCMVHLAECGFQNTAIRSTEEFIAMRHRDPLLAYASDAWADHARESLNMEDTRRRIANFINESGAYPSFTVLDSHESFDILRPLHILAIHNLPVSLITRKAIGDPNGATQISKDSPLTFASWLGREDIVNLLLAHPDIQVNLGNKKAWPALMYAARYGWGGIIGMLVAHRDIQVNFANDEGSTALMYASRYGHENIVRLLLAHPEIQVNIVNNKAWSALMYAACHGHDGIVKLFLARPEIQVNLVEYEQWSALMLATANRHEGVVTLLLARSEIQVNLVDKDGWSALMLAASTGHEGVVTLLLSRPDIQVNLVDGEWWSALMFAANFGHQGVVALLLAHQGIQVNLINRQGSSALVKAARHGYEGIVTLLLARPEIQVNLVEHEALSALMLAAANGHEGVVRLLLARPEIQINLVNDNWLSALMLAAANGQEGVVKMLLVRNEIEINSVDDRGWSALMLAIEGGHESIVKLLLAVPNVDTDLWNLEDGHSAISIALTNRHMGIVQLLEEYEPRAAAEEMVDDGVRSEYDSDGSDSYHDAEEWLGGMAS